MPPKPPASYAAFELEPDKPPALEPEPTIEPVKGRGHTLKEASAHIMTYIHPAAAKALKRYAVENNCKVHDLCVEALENWFRSHGLKEQVRADPKRRI